MKRRALYVDPLYTVTDDMDPERQVRRTPGNWAEGGMVGLLDRIARQVDGEGVLVLGADALAPLGLPTTADQIEDRGAAIIAETSRGGWNCSKVGDWSKFWAKERPTIHVCNSSLIETNETAFPLWDTHIPTMVAHLRQWHDLTGYAWRTTPAWSGIAILTGLDEERVAASRHGSAAPTTWKLTKKPDGPDDGFEDDYRRKHWTRRPAEDEPRTFAHCFDGIRAYMGAAGVVEVSPWALTHTGRISFDPKRAGWWLCELAPWNIAHMPDPAGYVDYIGPDDVRRRLRWLTTPTVALLEELTDEGVYGGVRIVDSWTNRARRYPTKPYVERMRDAFLLLDHRTGKPLEGVYPADAEVLQKAVKIVGHKTWGATDDATNWVFRPHWWHSIVAQWRANVWRKCWRIGKHTGRWPLYIETDAIWYPSDQEDPENAARELQWEEGGKLVGIVLDRTGRALGKFAPKGAMRLRTNRRRVAA